MKTILKVYGADKKSTQTHTQPSPENLSKGPARFFVAPTIYPSLKIITAIEKRKTIRKSLPMSFIF